MMKFTLCALALVSLFHASMAVRGKVRGADKMHRITAKKMCKKGGKAKGKGPKGPKGSDPPEVRVETFIEVASYAGVFTVPCHGLDLYGINYGFSVGGNYVPDVGACSIGVGPGPQNSVDEPGLEGTTQGVLTLSFDTPTTILRFGAARSAPDKPGLPPQDVHVTTYNSCGDINTQSSFVLGPDGGAFVGGTYQYTGNDPVSGVEISFPNGLSERFLVDNIIYETFDINGGPHGATQTVVVSGAQSHGSNETTSEHSHWTV